MRRVFIAFIAACSLTSLGVFGQTPRAMGRVEGTVFVGASSGHAFAAGATVRLSGPVVFETETDENGNYTFAEVASGSYRIEVFLSGLEAARAISVEAGKIVRAELQLKPADVKSSVTVTATAPETKDPAPSETISEKTLRDAPNVNERFESSLPLVPGVLRGPDGHINLKGARNTQSGALVNSANVTDPVTGGTGINLPIDVVSAVQVISNPYDPQYGKFTGAVVTVATKTSDYDKFHFSIQNIVPRLRDRDGTIAGLGAATPRMTFTGPIMKGRIAITQSFEYRYIRTPALAAGYEIREFRLLHTIRFQHHAEANSHGVVCTISAEARFPWPEHLHAPACDARFSSARLSNLRSAPLHRRRQGPVNFAVQL